MGLDDHTELGLSLSCHEKPANHDHDHQHQSQKKPNFKFDQLLPSDLTLGPSDDAEPRRSSSSSPSGAISSFSNSSSFKRDLPGSGEEVERVISEEVYEDQAGSPRKKLRLTKEQSATLEDSFKQHTTLNPRQKLELARNLSLRPRQVEVWFQNRRARTKLKQTEADCELLKKCCETLKEENRRLHKELQELQLMKQTPTTPFYMQFPTATLTAVCPSCSERIGNGKTSSAVVAGDDHRNGVTKPHFLNPFTHPSTASC